MKNPKLRSKKIAKAKRIVAQSIDIKPPLWAIIWSKRTL